MIIPLTLVYLTCYYYSIFSFHRDDYRNNHRLWRLIHQKSYTEYICYILSSNYGIFFMSIMEELLYRGIVSFNPYDEYKYHGIVIAIGTILFVIDHLGNNEKMMDKILYLPHIAIVSVLLYIIYYEYGLWCSILLHIYSNLLSSFCVTLPLI